MQAPIASTKELLDFLNQLEDIQVITETFKNPRPDDVRRIYSALVTHVLDIRTEDIINQNNLQKNSADYSTTSISNYNEASYVLTNPEEHVDSVIEMEFYKYIQKILTSSGYMEFSFKDLISPTGPRFVKQLSAILNLLRFREHYALKEYETMMFDATAYEVQKEELEKSLDADTILLSRLREKNQNINSSIKSLKSETTELTQTLRELDINRVKLEQEAARLQKINATNAQTLANEKEQVTKLQAECDILQTQIVHNPEELKKKIIELRTTIEKTRAQQQDKENTRQNILRERDGIRKLDKDTQSAVKSLYDYEKEANRRTQQLKSMQDKNNMIEELQEDCNQLLGNKQHLIRQTKNLENKIDNLKNANQQKQKMSMQTLSDLKNKKVKVTEEVDAIQRRIYEVQVAIAKKRQQGEDISRNHNAEMLQMKQEYEGLSSVVRNVHQRLYDRTPLVDMTNH
ncbi:kinetochore protein nuf2 [Acrasis kona]|uniref:Kinetochore protein nuf2 n=1 Tax=Acrasis kona TaxID=1008807 RepID=A0AAW2YXL9_9EUKA